MLKRGIPTKYGTFGVLTTDDGTKFPVVERNYYGNLRNVSSVPVGEYRLVPHHSEKHGETVALVNHALSVHHLKHSDGRYGILIHAANRASELFGCIAPGLDNGIVDNEWAVIKSKSAMKQLREYFKTDNKLVIE